VFGVAWLLGWWKNDAIAVALTFGMMLMINVRLAMLSRAWTRYSRPLLVGVALGLAAVQAAALVAVR
jgi:hypothetical protein